MVKNNLIVIKKVTASLLLIMLLFAQTNKAFSANKSLKNHENLNRQVRKNLLDVYMIAEFEYDESKPERTRIIGTTNLPNGTKMFVSLRRRQSGWNDFTEVHVKNGRFFSDFLVGHLIRMNKEIARKNSLEVEPLSPGEYRLHFIMTLPPFQPNSVIKIIGINGEFLSGSLVKKPYSKEYRNPNVGYRCEDYGNTKSECQEVEDTRTIDFSISLKISGEELEVEDNRVGNEEMNKMSVVTSEKIMEYTNVINGRGYSDIILEASVKPAKEKLQMVLYCKSQDKILSGICYAQHIWEDAIADCKSNISGKDTDKYIKDCLSDIGIKQ